MTNMICATSMFLSVLVFAVSVGVYARPTAKEPENGGNDVRIHVNEKILMQILTKFGQQINNAKPTIAIEKPKARSYPCWLTAEGEKKCIFGSEHILHKALA